MILKITSPEGVDYRQVMFFFISEDKLSVQFVAANGQTTTLQGMEVTDQRKAHVFDLYTDELHIMDGVSIELPPEEQKPETPPEQFKAPRPEQVVMTNAVPEATLPVEDGIGEPEGEA